MLTILLILSNWSTAIAAEAPTFGRLTHGVVCASILSGIPTEIANDPKRSLWDAADLLNGLKGPKKPAPRHAPYGSVSLTGVRGAWDLLQRNDVAVALERITQLQHDVRDKKLNGTVVGFEFRGFDDVRTARDQFVAAANANDQRFHDGLNRWYPPDRWTKRLDTGARLAASAFFIPIGLVVAKQDPALGYGLGAFFTVATSTVMYALRNSRDPEYSVNFPKHLNEIDAGLDPATTGTVFTMFSGTQAIDAELNDVLMKSRRAGYTDAEFELIVEAGETYAYTWFDASEISDLRRDLLTKTLTREQKKDFVRRAADEWRKRHPDGARRLAHWDSIFYLDPLSGEPVWLLYYRAMRGHAEVPPRRPVTAPDAVEASEADWDQSGALPKPAR